MGLAAYGNPKTFCSQFEQIVRVGKEDYSVSADFIGFHGRQIDRLEAMVGAGRFSETEQLLPRHADIAAALQEATDAAVLALVRRGQRQVKSDKL